MLKMRSVLVVLVALCWGCGDDAGGVVDAGSDSGSPVDASGPVDAGADEDGGVLGDAGVDDAGVRDAGIDAAVSDAGLADASTDAGEPDAGPCEPLTETGCPSGSWCRPADDLMSGTCTMAGAGTSGMACAENDDCGSGLICVGEVCTEACDSRMGDLGCGDDAGCAALRGVDGVPINLGTCIATCDYDGDATCPGDLSCLPPDVSSTNFDACFPGIPNLPAGGDCALGGVSRLGLCAPGRICYSRADLPPGLICWDYCRASVAPLSTPEHPDCFAGDRCVQFAVGLGVCVPR